MFMTNTSFHYSGNKVMNFEVELTFMFSILCDCFPLLNETQFNHMRLAPNYTTFNLQVNPITTTLSEKRLLYGLITYLEPAS